VISGVKNTSFAIVFSGLPEKIKEIKTTSSQHTTNATIAITTLF
jgi:hypothetical protein